MNQTKAISNRREMLFNFLLAFAAIAFLTTVTMYVFPAALAETTNNAKSVVKLVMRILEIICCIVGALFTIIGIVKYAISHANEDGPAQQKAIMMMATGVILVLLGAAVLTNLEDTVAGWVGDGTIKTDDL